MGLFDIRRRRKTKQLVQAQPGQRLPAPPRPLSPYSSFASHPIQTLDALYPVHLLIIDHLFALAPTKVLLLSRELHHKYRPVLYQRLVVNSALLSSLRQSTDAAHDRYMVAFREARALRFASAQSVVSFDPLLSRSWSTRPEGVGDTFRNLERIEISWEALEGAYGSSGRWLVQVPARQQRRKGTGNGLDDLVFEVGMATAWSWGMGWTAMGNVSGYINEMAPMQVTLRVGKDVEVEKMGRDFLAAVPMRWAGGKVVRIVFANTESLPPDPSSLADSQSRLLAGMIRKDIRSRYYAGLAREEVAENNLFGPRIEYCLVDAEAMGRLVKQAVVQEVPQRDKAGVTAYMDEKCCFVELRRYRADSGGWEYRTQEEACRRY